MSIVITAIKKIYKEEGVEIYLDKYRYYCLAEDYISDKDDQFLEQLYLCAENNILEFLYQVHKETSPQKQDRLLQKAKKQFSQIQNCSSEDAASFFQNYADAFGWKITTKSAEEEKFEEDLAKILRGEFVLPSKQQKLPTIIYVPVEEDTSSGNTAKHKVKKKHHFLRWLFLIIAVLAGYLGVGIYQSDSYISNIETGISNETSFFETFPLMDYVLDWRLKETVDKAVKSYNKGKTTYEEAFSEVSVFTSSSIEKYAQEKLTLLKKLSTSKKSYKLGVKGSDNEYYIEAAWDLSHVAEEDSLYKKAKKLKKKIKKDFTKELTSKMEKAVSDADYVEAVRLSGIGGRCYPSDDKLSGLKRAGDDCGNPFIYQIVHNIYKDIKKVEKDKDNKKQDCYSMMVFKLDDMHFLLGALFGTVEGSGVSDYSIVCYSITLDDISGISQSEYKSYMEGEGQLEKLEFRWDPSISKKDKEGVLYEQFIKLGPSYEGDTSGISYISKSEPAQNSSNQLSAWRLLLVAILEGAAVIVVIIIIVKAIKSIF